jgi:hypothetical protein
MPAGAPVLGTLWDGVLDDCPGVRSGAGPVPLGTALPAVPPVEEGGAAPAPVVPPVTEEGAVPGLAVVAEGGAEPVPAAPPVVPAPPAAPAALPPAAPPPAPPAPPAPPPPLWASARGMLRARTMAAMPACKESERMGRSSVGMAETPTANNRNGSGQPRRERKRPRGGRTTQLTPVIPAGSSRP